MAKVFRTLRTHWKKSTFAAVLGYYGINYGLDWHKNYLLMREYSKEALAHGNRPLPTGAKNKHITLLLNPTAGNRKSKSKLEKYAEPLFHLSGFLVNIVKTERMDEARDLAGIIEKTNLIVVAGGDGTVFETITGIMRRGDAEEAIRKYPIGVIPLGHSNQFAKRLMRYKDGTPEPQFIAESAMAVVRHKMKLQDLMEITIIEDPLTNNESNIEEPSKPKKPFYSLAGISIGQYRDAEKIKDEMPSLFPNYFATFLSLYRTPDKLFKAQIRYIPTCDGCLKCKETEPEATQTVATVESKATRTQPSILSRLFSVFQPQPVHAQNSSQKVQVSEIVLPKGEESIVNPNCGSWDTLCVETSEVNVKPCGNGKLQIQVGQRLTKTDFMIEGLKRYRKEPCNFSQTVDCKEIEIIPVEGQESLSVDNEEFDMKRIRVKCLKNKVYFFTK